MLRVIVKLAAAFAVATSALGVQDVLDALKNADPSFKSPGLTYLYNANITGTGMIFLGQGPRGTRIVAPITGGAFVGPRLKGMFFSLYSLSISIFCVLAFLVPTIDIVFFG